MLSECVFDFDDNVDVSDMDWYIFTERSYEMVWMQVISGVLG